MRDFNRDYLRLLRDQVEVEIKYLKSVGHDSEIINQPCIWCNMFKGRYMCNRLHELKEFLSQIVVRQNGQPKEDNKAEFSTLSCDGLLPSNPDPF
jgi:hypothetical protein